MSIRSFLSRSAKTLKLAVKPGTSELWLSIKICFLGIGAIGLIGFVIKLIASALIGTPVASTTS
jgi:protein translocase SEC61 complex gamma subunit